MAFAHLERMRSVRALHGQVIDCNGNFVQDSANPKARTGSDDSLRDVPFRQLVSKGDLMAYISPALTAWIYHGNLQRLTLVNKTEFFIVLIMISWQL